MRLNSFHLAVALATGTLVVSFNLPAADEPGSTPERRSTSSDRADRYKGITDELKLTPEQQEKLRPLLQEEGKKMRAIYQDVKLSREQKLAKMKESRTALREKLKLILTPSQLETWDKLSEQRAQRISRGTK
jgi:Spy/CpxP family protein refolding chaperone